MGIQDTASSGDSIKGKKSYVHLASFTVHDSTQVKLC